LQSNGKGHWCVESEITFFPMLRHQQVTRKHSPAYSLVEWNKLRRTDQQPNVNVTLVLKKLDRPFDYARRLIYSLGIVGIAPDAFSSAERTWRVAVP
jgi:hypothetical protein